MSYIPGADITWYKFSQPLNEAEDEVTIRKINDVTSVLRIDKAQIKKHKKSYTCRVEFEGRSEDISLNLKVMAAKRKSACVRDFITSLYFHVILDSYFGYSNCTLFMFHLIH